LNEKTRTMKNIGKFAKVTLILGLFIGWSLAAKAQGGPPPPPPGGGHGQTTNQPPEGGTAPLGGGMALLLVMGAAWGAGRVYTARRKGD
jgi:hypothetical protein